MGRVRLEGLDNIDWEALADRAYEDAVPMAAAEIETTLTDRLSPSIVAGLPASSENKSIALMTEILENPEELGLAETVAPILKGLIPSDSINWDYLESKLEQAYEPDLPDF